MMAMVAKTSLEKLVDAVLNFIFIASPDPWIC